MIFTNQHLSAQCRYILLLINDLLHYKLVFAIVNWFIPNFCFSSRGQQFFFDFFFRCNYSNSCDSNTLIHLDQSYSLRVAPIDSYLR